VYFRKMWSLALCMATLGLAGCGGTRPDGLGLTDGRLAPCPDSSNCVSSQVESGYASMEPIVLDVTPEAAQDAIIAVLQGMDRIEIITVEPGYIHAEAKSRLVGFVDDVEFAIDEAEGLIHYRSASRMGYGDVGANRERMVEIWGKYADVIASQKAAVAAL